MTQDTAVFAMGCFWCGESDFRNPDSHATLPGIISVRVGYAGGTKPNPTYEDHEGYKEAVKIAFDPSKISYEELLKIFWNSIDPLDPYGQFCDKGSSYTSAIFYLNEAQKAAAIKSSEQVQKRMNKQKLATEIIPYTTFYDAEEYHQNYKEKNPLRYHIYRTHSGRK